MHDTASPAPTMISSQVQLSEVERQNISNAKSQFAVKRVFITADFYGVLNKIKNIYIVFKWCSTVIIFDTANPSECAP